MKGFTPHQTKQALKGIELQVKKTLIRKNMGNPIRKSSTKKVPVNSKLKATYSISQRKTFCRQKKSKELAVRGPVVRTLGK